MMNTAELEKVPFSKKLILGMGSLPLFLGWATFNTVAYRIFNMELEINPVFVSFALVLPRIWDAFTDPFMGQISDNFHRSKWGRRRPFIFWGAIFNALAFATMWLFSPEWSGTAIISYFIVLELIFFTSFTVYSVPYTALTYEMTPDYNERTRVMAFTAFFNKMGEFFNGWIIYLCTAVSIAYFASDGLSMQGIRSVCGIIALVIFLGIGILPALFVKERFADQSKQQEKVKLIDSCKSAFQSRPFLILIAIIVFNMLAGTLAMSMDYYLIMYYMAKGNELLADGLKATLTTGYAVVGFASIPLLTWIATRIGKSGTLYLTYGLMVIGGIAKWFIFVPGHSLYYIGKFAIDPILMIDPLLCGPMWVAVNILLNSMMADICDEDELKHGNRREGVFGAIYSWLQKAIFAAGTMFTGIAVAVSGFVATQGIDQSTETFTKMRLFLAGGPALAAMLAIVALFFYPITAKRAANTRKELEERRGAI